MIQIGDKIFMNVSCAGLATGYTAGQVIRVTSYNISDLTELVNKGFAELIGASPLDPYNPGVGIKGDKGDKGDTGEQGLPGVNGTNGIDGVDGHTPVKGIDYFDGINGIQGERGLQGEQGLPGLKGDKGDTGLQGEQGIPGLNGADGLPGAKGDKGDTGEQGQQGLPGIKGDTGDQGLQGIPGIKGDTGLQGEQGIQGNPGSDAQVTKANVEAVLTGEISTHTHAGGSGGMGYTLTVQALTSSPGDGATVYFGQLPKAPISTANVSKVYVRKAGTIKIAQIYCYSGTAGTNESWSLYIRKNNTTDYLIATVAVAASERIFTNSNLNIPMIAGDYFEIKSVQPTWATNPLTTIYGGYIYIE